MTVVQHDRMLNLSQPETPKTDTPRLHLVESEPTNDTPPLTAEIHDLLQRLSDVNNCLSSRVMQPKFTSPPKESSTAVPRKSPDVYQGLFIERRRVTSRLEEIAAEMEKDLTEPVPIGSFAVVRVVDKPALA